MLFLYLIFFSILFLYNYRKHGFTPSSFLLAIYLTASVMSLILMYYFQTFDDKKISFAAVSFHIVCLYLFLSPIIYFGNIDIKTIIFPPYSILKYLIGLIVILSFISIAVSWQKMKIAFSFNELKEARRLHNLRELYDDDRNIFTYLGTIGQHLSIFAMLFFFHFVVTYPQKKIIQMFLFLSSFAVVFANLAIVGRDGIVRWVFFMIFCFSLFRNSISQRVKSYIYRLFLIGAIPAIYVFSLITDSRFSDRNQGILYFICSYIGQPFLYFSYNFNAFMLGTSGGRMNFPIFFPKSERVLMNNLNDTFYADYNLNTFPTFVGSFYIDLGLLKTLLLAIAFYLFFTLYFRIKKPKASFPKLIAFSALYQIVLLGVFYYMFYSITVINAILSFFLVVIFLEYLAGLSKKKHNKNQLSS